MYHSAWGRVMLLLSSSFVFFALKSLHYFFFSHSCILLENDMCFYPYISFTYFFFKSCFIRPIFAIILCIHSLLLFLYTVPVLSTGTSCRSSEAILVRLQLPVVQKSIQTSHFMTVRMACEVGRYSKNVCGRCH